MCVRRGDVAVGPVRERTECAPQCEAFCRPGLYPPTRGRQYLTSTAKRQVTLRKDILKHLGVAPGERVSVEKLPDGRVEVTAALTGKISDVFDYLKKPGRRALSVGKGKGRIALPSTVSSLPRELSAAC